MDQVPISCPILLDLNCLPIKFRIDLMKVFKSKDNLHHLQVQARNVLPILVTLSTSDLQSRANGRETHKKLPII